VGALGEGLAVQLLIETADEPQTWNFVAERVNFIAELPNVAIDYYEDAQFGEHWKPRPAIVRMHLLVSY
jgi:hypothetical protein